LALMWNEGGVLGYPVHGRFYDKCAVTYYIEAYGGSHVPGEYVDIMFCDGDWEELPDDYIIGLDDPLRIKVKAKESDIDNYRMVALVTDQMPVDTVYYYLPIRVSDFEARGSVEPVRSLGQENRVYITGFGVVYGIVSKGEDIETMDWVDAGHVFITVDGTVPETAYSFISAHQFICEVVYRDDHGQFVPAQNLDAVSWSSQGTTPTSGNLNPSQSTNIKFTTTPNPDPAPYARQYPLRYRITCQATHSGATEMDYVDLCQDEIDRLRQQYIDTQKSMLPAREEFRITGSEHFSPLELRSSDFTVFLFNQGFLNALEQTRIQYANPMIIYQSYGQRRAYSSPARHFTSTPGPPHYGYPSYWEGNSESPHIYGYAIDIVTDGEIQWSIIADIMENHGIIASNPAGDYSYIHGEFPIQSETLISLELEPNSVVPGRQDTYPGHGPDIIRQIEICGHVDNALAPYTDGELVLSVDEVLFSGGHAHPGRPMNHDPVPNRISGQQLQQNNGEFYADYEDPCQWGGQYQVRAYFLRGAEAYYGIETLNIRWEDLYELNEHESYDLVGWSDQHPDNHFVRQEYFEIPKLIAINFYELVSDSFPEDTLPTVYINDMSLVQGGRFDIGQTSGCPNCALWEYPHKSHRIGCSMDTQYHNQSANLKYYKLFKRAILNILEEYIPEAPIPDEHPELNYNHIHVWFCEYQWE
jgi:hypothetical protein